MTPRERVDLYLAWAAEDRYPIDWGDEWETMLRTLARAGLVIDALMDCGEWQPAHDDGEAWLAEWRGEVDG